MDHLCIVDLAADIEVSAEMSVSLSCDPAIVSGSVEVVANSTVSITATRDIGTSITTEVGTNVTLNVDANNAVDIDVSVDITDGITATYALTKNIDVSADLIVANMDKYTGDFSLVGCLQKLYPVADIQTSGVGFVNELNSSSDLYASIDDGVHTGDYITQGENGQIVADENTYIQPDTDHTEGLFKYKCELSTVSIKPESSNLRFRASTPLMDVESRIPPTYTIHDIRFEDPSGNLVIAYEDITVKGDSQHVTFGDVNYSTHSTTPVLNNTLEYDWDANYPLMHQGDGYTLSFNMTVESNDDAFDSGFSLGFEDNRIIPDSIGSGNDYLALDGNSLSSQTNGLLNGVRGIRIAGIEICNSGAVGPGISDYLPIYAPVRDKGHRVERTIKPTYLYADTVNEVWPNVSTTWTGNLSKLLSSRHDNHIRMESSTIADSGKLVLRFGHSATDRMKEITDGSFGTKSFDASTYGMWVQPFGAFDTQNKNHMDVEDNFFTIDSVSLRILAKKEVGSRDFSIDVVGYSDDGLLNVTSQVGGFLQNIEGSGDIPVASGFLPSDDLGIDGEPLSSADQYYESSGTNNAGGDHYLLSPTVITSEEFTWYEIPLKVYEDTVALGKSRDYNNSSMFERLNLDIYPVPSGAEIADIELLIRHAPQNAIMFSVDGSEAIRHIANTRSEARLIPVKRQATDDAFNLGPAFQPISLIEGIPHGFSTPPTLKTNYSRRWRGVEGTVNGPFQPSNFAFGFENPVMEYPFLSGYFRFDCDAFGEVNPAVGSLSGTFDGTANDRYQNLGWRFLDSDIFAGHSGNYKSIDWTTTTSGVTDYTSSPIYGQIADAFDSAVRVNYSKPINLPVTDMSQGFSVFTRFSPDIDATWDSGVIVSKWDSGNSLEFTLGYESGVLCATAMDVSGSIVKIVDTAEYHQYTFPLSVLLTYNDHGSHQLKLYTDNENFSENPLVDTPNEEDDYLSAGGSPLSTQTQASLTGDGPSWATLRATSEAFTLNSDVSQLRIGKCSGSGVGYNAFITELGVSTNNIVESGANIDLREVTAQKFLENHRSQWWIGNSSYIHDNVKLWSYIDENTDSDWTLGSYGYTSFGPAFSQLKSRPNKEMLRFTLAASGTPYSGYIERGLPTTLNSAVSYHSQIENDFLRLYLSDTANNFYAVPQRVTKALPRGYNFAEEAMAVDTVISHNGEGSGKLIVSLYTKRKEPYWTPDENNWGLVNRYAHQLDSNTAIHKLTSVFDYDSLLDETEQWALFPEEPRLREFEETYFSTDVDDMFIQYDLVFPSGDQFKAEINIHSSNVRLKDAFVQSTERYSMLNMYSSGNPSPVNGEMNLFASNFHLASGDVFNLYTVGPIQIQESGFPIYTSGLLMSTASLGMNVHGQETTSSTLNVNVTGDTEANIRNLATLVNINTIGKGVISSSGDGVLGMSLSLLNNEEVQIPSGSPLSLFVNATETNLGVTAHLPIFSNTDDMYSTEGRASTLSGVVNLTTVASAALVNRYPDAKMNLYTFSNNPTESMNLTSYGDSYSTNQTVGQINLFNATYGPTTGGAAHVRWFDNNYGVDIDLEDNVYATIPSDADIRGVDLVGYGSCTGNSPQKAVERAVISHGVTWYAEQCYDAGIFRAYDTLNGEYYDIRKYSDLTPNAPYNITLTVDTGDTESVPAPPEFEEWEYGTNSTLAFSGVQHSNAEQDEKMGTSVAVKGDLMAVGSPFKDIVGESGQILTSAGTVYLYRRNPEIAGTKADWVALDDLILPSGFRGDYSIDAGEIITYPGVGSISGNKWSIGQEGRELGHAVDIANSGNREVIVVGAPGAQWNRTFDEIITEKIPVGIMLFVDNFEYDEDEVYRISNVVRKWDVLYKYFSAPWYPNTSGEFQPELDIKVMVCQCVDSSEEKPLIPKLPAFISHTYVGKLNDSTVGEKGSEEWAVIKNDMVSGVKEIFNATFQRDSGRLYNNLPPILGIFQDSSNSLNGAFASFTEATEEVVDEFETYFKELTFASGVGASGYVNRTLGNAEDWMLESIDLMDDTLATGNLIENSALGFITSGVGQEWANENALDFQISPPSGGRVYVYENENGVFNLIQEIKSPDELGRNSYSLGNYGQVENDRFGHSVSISDNAEVISVGSPYSNHPCKIYEDSSSERQRLFNGLPAWLNSQGIIIDDNVLASESGRLETYYGLTQSEKFKFRSDETFWNSRGGIPQPYKSAYDYRYTDIPYTGTWSFIPGHFAGTSRLGYSTSVSEDGNTVVFGAPTDSFNEFDDTNVWFKSENTWASYVNAGAVRVFESRNYFPHSGVVEFYRFGNLDKNSHPEASGSYEDLKTIFNNSGRSFERLPFDDIEIPQDAGLAFIITPELDSASDEVIDNIKNWMALGDRTLVLVGNDPSYEEGGKYAKSNAILHKILKKLDSRMRIHPARNEYEAINYCADVSNNRYNVTNAYVPANAHSTAVNNGPIYASGVGDIRIDLNGLDVNKPDLLIDAPCNILNDRCNMPIQHGGDLRAEWNAMCTKRAGNTVIEIHYKENWPFHFGNEKRSQDCDSPPSQLIDRPNQEPRPLLTAAEYVAPSSYTVPATSGWVDLGCTTTYKTVTTRQTVWEFGSTPIDNLEFGVSGVIEAENSVSGVGLAHIGHSENHYNPLFMGDRDGIIQGSGSSYTLPPVNKTAVLDNNAVLATEESYKDTTSSVVMIASVFPENKNSMEGRYGDRTNLNSDQNIFFYANLMRESCNDAAVVKQLGGWTRRVSFADAYSESQLIARLSSTKIGTNAPSIEENYTGNLNNVVDIVWIANPAELPSESDITKLTNWLAIGGKRLVLTYDQRPESAQRAAFIMKSLGMTSTPHIDRGGRHVVHSTDTIGNSNKQTCCPYDEHEEPLQLLDSDSEIIAGCVNTYGKSSRLEKLVISGEEDSYIPIKANNATKLIYFNENVHETYQETPTAWQIKGESDLIFNVTPGSGYRIYYSWVSEFPEERYALDMRINNVSLSADPKAGSSHVNKNLSGTSVGFPQSAYVDVKVPSGVNTVSFEFTSDRWRNIPSSNEKPYTPRVLSVSGAMLPTNPRVLINSEQIIDPDISPNPVCSGEWRPIPSYIVTIPEQFRPIMTDNTKYCQDFPNTSTLCKDKGGLLIEDGPVVAAEELEHFSAFSNGQNRSRIILISDSSIVQGACEGYRDDALTGNQRFIRSLYPPSPSTNNTSGGRSFEFTQKLLSPERGSPAKSFAVNNIANNISAFGMAGVSGNLNSYVDDENNTHPGDVVRPADPVSPEQIKAEIRSFGQNVTTAFGMYPRFSGAQYIDAGIMGGMPSLMRDSGVDHINLSENPGDLFGYSVSLHENKLMVGSPFNSYGGSGVTPWTSGGSGNVEYGSRGGGAVFYYENTNSGVNVVSEFLPWEFKQKLKADTVSPEDRFGASVSIDHDFVAIGAPGHGSGVTYEDVYDSDAFIRKEFNAEFSIPEHNVYDSGAYVDNAGAVYTYSHFMVNWQTRYKEWTYAEKMVAQEGVDREDDYFGLSVSIDRPLRGDGDYTMIVGAPEALDSSGVMFTYDAMLRSQVPAIANSGSYIHAAVFGHKSENNLNIVVNQNVSGGSQTYSVSGIVSANQNGDIFLEASGYDPSLRGFIKHRPFVKIVTGEILDGTKVTDYMNIGTIGSSKQETESMNLTIVGPTNASVYNTLDLTTSSWNEAQAGSGNPGLNLTTEGTATTTDSAILNLGVSGIGTPTPETLNLRLRGK